MASGEIGSARPETSEAWLGAWTRHPFKVPGDDLLLFDPRKHMIEVDYNACRAEDWAKMPESRDPRYTAAEFDTLGERFVRVGRLTLTATRIRRGPDDPGRHPDGVDHDV